MKEGLPGYTSRMLPPFQTLTENGNPPVQLHGMIFDLDGTLTDTFSVCFIAFRKTIQAVLDRSPSDEEIFAHFGPGEEGMFQRWVPDRWEFCLRLYLSHYEQEHRRIGRLFSGVESALNTLRACGIPMAIVTGKGAYSAEISMEQLGLTPYFDVIETGSPEGNVKRQAIQKVLTRWRIHPSQVAYLGDAVSDIEVAHDVGALPLAAAWEPRADIAALRAVQPHAAFRTVSEFHEWITTRLHPAT